MPKRTCDGRACGAALIGLIIGATLSGCAHRGVSLEAHPPVAGASPASRAGSLSSFIEKVQKLSAEASAGRWRPGATTIEGAHPELGAALIAAAAEQTPEAHREVARVYARLGIVDAAHEHLNRALRLDPTDAMTYEALARLWRDCRLPHVALGDAHRAVYYAPQWAEAHNTLGTVLQGMGRRAEAREAYERVLQLQPTAAYALNNLCYGWILDGQVKKAIAACRRALEIEPSLRAARNNLGLAHAAANDMGAARQAFAEAGDRAAASYNLGVVHLARREYQGAVKAFETAQAIRPDYAIGAARVRQARQMVNQGNDE